MFGTTSLVFKNLSCRTPQKINTNGESFGYKMNFQQSPNSRQRSSNSYTTPKTPTTPDIFHSNDYKPRLFDEISILARGFGDSIVNQNRDAIVLIEKIVIQQLRGILNEVMNVAYKRTGSIVPSQVDWEFLLRRNATKLNRFRKHMRKVCQLKVDPSLGINFLNRLADDATSDEETEIYDPEKMRRLMRADRISQILNPQKYEEFQKARTWSSNVRNKAEMLRKLVDILQVPKEMQEQSTCLETLLYLAQETIATLVDFSILTRLTTDNHITDPFTITSSISNNMLHICPEVTQGRGQEGIKAITVQEINEAIRRVQTMATRRMGTFRSEMKIPYLAL